jgi:hypothetical protein
MSINNPERGGLLQNQLLATVGSGLEPLRLGDVMRTETAEAEIVPASTVTPPESDSLLTPLLGRPNSPERVHIWPDGQPQTRRETLLTNGLIAALLSEVAVNADKHGVDRQVMLDEALVGTRRLQAQRVVEERIAVIEATIKKATEAGSLAERERILGELGQVEAHALGQIAVAQADFETAQIERQRILSQGLAALASTQKREGPSTLGSKKSGTAAVFGPDGLQLYTTENGYVTEQTLSPGLFGNGLVEITVANQLGAELIGVINGIKRTRIGGKILGEERLDPPATLTITDRASGRSYEIHGVPKPHAVVAEIIGTSRVLHRGDQAGQLLTTMLPLVNQLQQQFGGKVTR